MLTRTGAPQGHRSPSSLRTEERSKTISTEQADDEHLMSQRGARYRDVSGRGYDKSPTFRKNSYHLLTRVRGRPEQALELLTFTTGQCFIPPRATDDGRNFKTAMSKAV